MKSTNTNMEKTWRNSVKKSVKSSCWASSAKRFVRLASTFMAFSFSCAANFQLATCDLPGIYPWDSSGGSPFLRLVRLVRSQFLLQETYFTSSSVCAKLDESQVHSLLSPYIHWAEGTNLLPMTSLNDFTIVPCNSLDGVPMCFMTLASLLQLVYKDSGVSKAYQTRIMVMSWRSCSFSASGCFSGDSTGNGGARVWTQWLSWCSISCCFSNLPRITVATEIHGFGKQYVYIYMYIYIYVYVYIYV